MSTESQWLNVQDIADVLQVKEETVRRWIRRKDLPVLDLGGPRAAYRIRREDLDHFIWQRYRMRDQQDSDREFRGEFADSPERVLVLESVQIIDPPRSASRQMPSAAQESTSAPDARYLSLLSRVPGIAYVATAPLESICPRQITFVSPEFESIVDDPAALLTDNPDAWWSHVHPDDRERVHREVSVSCRTGARLVSEYRILSNSGEVCWVRDEAVQAEPLDDGETTWQGVILNITDRKRVAETLEARIRQHTALAELGEHALKEIDLPSLFNEAVEYVHASLDVDYTKVLELLPGGQELLMRAGGGWKPGVVNQTKVSAGAESQAGYTLLSNEPVIVADLQVETRFNGPSLLHDAGVRSGISVIIAGHGKPWGVLGAHSVALRRFTRDDIHFLQAVANILATAIRNSSANRQHGRWLSIRDVADSLRVKEETVRRWIRRGELPVVDLGSSRAGYRIHPADLEQFIQERYLQPASG